MAVIVQAEESYPRHYIQFNIGDNWMNSWYSGSSRTSSSSKYGAYHESPNYADWFPNYQQTYVSYEAFIPLTFSAQYFYAITHWLHLGGEIYYSGNFRNISQAGTGKLLSEGGNIQISVLPTIRFQYLDRKYVGLYSGLATGFYSNFIYDYGHFHPEFHIAWQFTWIGLRVGNRAFWTLEFGTGHKGFITTGVGMRL